MTTTQTDRLSGVLGNTAIKTPCAVATTAAITLSGEQTIDGVTTSASRVLVKNQASAIDNGIYISDTGAWERTQDFDGSRDVVEGTLVKVNGGSTTVGFWYVTTTGSPVPGTDAINFGQASTVLAVVTAWAQNILAAASSAAAWVFIKVGAIADANSWAGTQTFATTIFNGSATHNADITMVGASIVEAEGAAVTAASSTNIWATDGNTVHVTGNTGIADFATAPQAGAWMKVIFDGTPLLTQSANLNLNAGGANVTIAAGDMAFVYADTTTQMDVFVIRASGNGVSSVNGNTGAVNSITLDTPQNAGGTSIDFNSIPTTARRIFVNFAGWSSNGTSPIIVQIGDAGGLETSGYVGGAASISATTFGVSSTAGYQCVSTSMAANAVFHGSVVLTLQNSSTNTWVMSAVLANSQNGDNHYAGGTKSLSAAIDRLRITTITGANTFDAGAVNITYE